LTELACSSISKLLFPNPHFVSPPRKINLPLSILHFFQFVRLVGLKRSLPAAGLLEGKREKEESKVMEQ
jgi:hypothetical protein